MFGLPHDILRLLYNNRRASEKEEEESTRMFYKNMILLMCLDSHGNLDVLAYSSVSMADTKLSMPIFSWLQTYHYMCRQREDWYSHRLPIDKNCEWGIKHSGLSERKPLKSGEDVRGFYDSREKLLAEIRIFGEEGYLTSKTSYINTDGEQSFVALLFPPPTLKEKILYLNNSPWGEVEMDYENFLEWKGSEHESGWRIIIDEFGEGRFL
jgi:hypothetical protein